MPSHGDWFVERNKFAEAGLIGTAVRLVCPNGILKPIKSNSSLPVLTTLKPTWSIVTTCGFAGSALAAVAPSSAHATIVGTVQMTASIGVDAGLVMKGRRWTLCTRLYAEGGPKGLHYGRCPHTVSRHRIDLDANDGLYAADVESLRTESADRPLPRSDMVEWKQKVQLFLFTQQ
jgi:hypothetical protein